MKSQERLEQAALAGRNMAKEVLDNIYAQLLEMEEPFDTEEKMVFWAAFEDQIDVG